MQHVPDSLQMWKKNRKKIGKKGERGRKKQQGTGKIYKRSWNPMNSPFEAFDLRLESNKEEFT